MSRVRQGSVLNVATLRMTGKTSESNVPVAPHRLLVLDVGERMYSTTYSHPCFGFKIAKSRDTILFKRCKYLIPESKVGVSHLMNPVEYPFDGDPEASKEAS